MPLQDMDAHLGGANRTPYLLGQCPELFLFALNLKNTCSGLVYRWRVVKEIPKGWLNVLSVATGVMVPGGLPTGHIALLEAILLVHYLFIIGYYSYPSF